ncbi:DUF6074 family protein [Rhizobium fabae]|uniref:Uncharacterized protein n=1 Tax=Rhizobium fabae TaxID=573179 RepID=A0A7W6B4Q9_9HYPH|nr:DUF6074 family protein [Rhizobium fabae]MBB3913873.1 hypothetical protein [Rhizobium fabae]RUM16309.1 hypothetical protein EFB14_03025 [Rhizobium fabae]
MRDNDLPLFAWQPPCKLIIFPMEARIGKIRDVALKMLDKTTDRHADWYRKQVTEALLLHLEKIGLPEDEQDEQLGAFWTKVEQEIVRMAYGRSGAGSNDPRGAA